MSTRRTLGIELKPLPVLGSHAESPSDDVGGAARVAKQLDYVVQRQEQTNWCWSAQGTSVGLFFGTGSWTQCDTAQQQTGSECCTDPAPCDVYGLVHQALEYTRSFNQRGTAPMPSADLISEIDAEHPIVMRCAWSASGAHFIALSGYEHPDGLSDQVRVTIQDSIYGESTMLLSDFPALYQSGGSWTHTYLTHDARGAASPSARRS